ncbi:MAG: hypothetical protein AMXMBFR33_05130 [Candidatus Xenobia bacterium]
MEGQDLYLTAQQAAQQLSMSLSRIYRLLRAGKLEARKQGSTWLISPQALTAASHSTLLDRLTPEREQSLAEQGLCPVCSAQLVQEENADDSSWAHEFRECTQCGFSFHEHAIESPEDLHKLVARHLTHLEKYVQAGRQASRALARRRKL